MYHALLKSFGPPQKNLFLKYDTEYVPNKYERVSHEIDTLLN